jgi:DNA-binding response OmpR family regulator
MKVLISDPDWRFAKHAGNYLESRAHLVVTETRRDAALARIERWRPDLVILAAELADEGFLAAVDAMPARPAVLLTGWMDHYADAWRAWQSGGDELLMKPVFAVDDLQESIVEAMENAATGRRRQRRPATATA